MRLAQEFPHFATQPTVVGFLSVRRSLYTRTGAQVPAVGVAGWTRGAGSGVGFGDGSPGVRGSHRSL